MIRELRKGEEKEINKEEKENGRKAKKEGQRDKEVYDILINYSL